VFFMNANFAQRPYGGMTASSQILFLNAFGFVTIIL
jgi:hypothetical protein